MNLIKCNISKQYVLNLVENYSKMYKSEKEELEFLRKENIELKKKLSKSKTDCDLKKPSIFDNEFIIDDTIKCEIDNLNT